MPQVDFDSPWKEALEKFLPELLWLLFPTVAAAIDWEVKPEFLDKELQQIIPEAALGRQYVDKLIKVRMLEGTEVWILLLIEVQSQYEAGIIERTYQYFHRTQDRFQMPVAALLILADSDERWRPSDFKTECLGCEVTMKIPVCKLLDFVDRVEELEKSENPAALIVLAHLRVIQSAGDMDLLARWKLELTKSLYNRGWKARQIRELYRLIDWLITLPESLALKYNRSMVNFEKKKRMPYITTAERIGIAKGLEKGLERGLEQGLEQGLERGMVQSISDILSVRFGVVPNPIKTALKKVHDISQLKKLHRLALTCPNIAKVKSALK